MKLQNKIAMVTGTSPNIGGGIVEELAQAGAGIVAVDALRENAEDCAAYIKSLGGQAIAVTCDVSNDAAVKGAVQAATAAFGRIDILVNNAATFLRKGVLEMSASEWSAQTAIILTGAFLCTKHVAHAMIARGEGGAIINVISTAGHKGDPGNIAYGTAKGGLLNFTRGTAMELAKHQIRVNSLTPTATDPREAVDRARRWGRDVGDTPPLAATMEAYRKGVPLLKLPKPSDYGKAAVFLASDDAAMMTGADLRIDGGAVARYWAWDPATR